VKEDKSMSAHRTTSSSIFMAGDGDGYELQMGRFSRLLAPLFTEFAGIKEGARVLDVGCGTGSLTFELARNPRIAWVEAVDFSPIYIEHAKRRGDDARLTFRVADACALPFEEASFDHTASMLVLAFVPQADQAVREMRRVTKAGGTVAAAMWDVRGGLVFARMFWDTAAMLDRRAVERRARSLSRPMTRPGDFTQAWQAARLREVFEDAITIRMTFSSFEDFWAPMEGKDGPFAEYVSTLSGEERTRLRDAVRIAYVDGEPDGLRSYAATAWAVRGTVPG
jgi:SAM-dependent methyltransferase